ncbi:MAG: hypothetical protein IPK21_13540 [Haliscomenobacter sp.]|nr:hypothetical protein [Haliscomenobacter sp.]
MGFVQFYFGLPLAMILLSVFVIPNYYRLNVYTAYEFLETRFGLPTRVLTASLFLMQRGFAAGLTILAPSIVLSQIMGWPLNWTIFLMGIVVIIYTVSGGTKAVSVTQTQQMVVILLGLVLASVLIILNLPREFTFGETLTVAGKMGKLNVLDFKFDLSNRYNFWSGMLGGTFLFLSYFGTDQSQVSRYLSGKSLTESRLGLMFNGLLKIPMQFVILFVGALVFVFYQFNPGARPLQPGECGADTAKQLRPGVCGPGNAASAGAIAAPGSHPRDDCRRAQRRRSGLRRRPDPGACLAGGRQTATGRYPGIDCKERQGGQHQRYRLCIHYVCAELHADRGGGAAIFVMGENQFGFIFLGKLVVVKIAYLWLNLIGCVLVMGLSLLMQTARVSRVVK